MCFFGKDTKTEFGIQKCAMLVMSKGKILTTVSIELPDGKFINSLQEGKNYKYLKISEADTLLVRKVKVAVSKGYFGRLSKVLK